MGLNYVVSLSVVKTQMTEKPQWKTNHCICKYAHQRAVYFGEKKTVDLYSVLTPLQVFQTMSLFVFYL